MKKNLGLFFISFALLFCSNIICAAVISSGTVGTVDIVADFSNMGSVDFSFELKIHVKKYKTKFMGPVF